MTTEYLSIHLVFKDSGHKRPFAYVGHCTVGFHCRLPRRKRSQHKAGERPTTDTCGHICASRIGLHSHRQTHYLWAEIRRVDGSVHHHYVSWHSRYLASTLPTRCQHPTIVRSLSHVHRYNSSLGFPRNGLSDIVPSVLWHCWLCHLTRKNPSPIWPITCLMGR